MKLPSSKTMLIVVLLALIVPTPSHAFEIPFKLRPQENFSFEIALACLAVAILVGMVMGRRKNERMASSYVEQLCLPIMVRQKKHLITTLNTLSNNTLSNNTLSTTVTHSNNAASIRRSGNSGHSRQPQRVQILRQRPKILSRRFVHFPLHLPSRCAVFGTLTWSKRHSRNRSEHE